MVRIVLGIITGFVVWSMVWVGSEATLIRFSPDWFGNHIADADKAFMNATTLVSDPLIVVVNLLRSVFTSIMAGYIAALVAGEFKQSTTALGVILLAVGIWLQYTFWNLAPTWYHILFLLLLLPMTVLGGRLRRSN